MRAIVVQPPTPGAQLADVSPPVLGPGQVRVGVLECGVCGTDRDIVDGKYGRPPAGSSRLILGHENLGTVLETRASAAGFAPGDLVVATVRRGCGECRFCLANRSDFCETGRFTERGIGGADGYMAEEYVDIPEYLVKVPPELRSFAVLLEPLSVVEKAVFQGQRVLDRKEPTPGQSRSRAPTALIAGIGAIGMLSALVLTMRGYQITAVDRHDDTTPGAQLVARLGGRHVNVGGGYGALGDASYDLIIEATGSPTADFSLIDCIGTNGVLVLTGVPDVQVPPSSVPGGHLFRDLVLGNQAIVGSVNANRTYFESGLRDMTVAEERWPGALDSMITTRVPIADFATVLLAPPHGGVKSVLVVRG
jgi:glucose 1-dehydrogenase